MRFDVIIVGAGSAGCALAARLTESRRSVLLLEAGPDYPDSAALPADIANCARIVRDHDWGYSSEPDVASRQIRLPRGKVVGGCSATNAVTAVRGAPNDYDEWAALGNAGWSFAEVLPFFRRLEHDVDFSNQWHGQDGPLPIRRFLPDALAADQRPFFDACRAAGYAPVPDHNAPDALGVGPWPMNGAHGIRWSAALTYLAPARSRPHLTVRGDTLVDRVAFTGQRATGVYLADSGELVEGRHIILAAGAYSSPAILLRSGVGPADDLRALLVPVVEDLPGVGRHLSDHPFVELRYTAPRALLAAGALWFAMLLTLKSAPERASYDLHICPTALSPDGDGHTPGVPSFALMASLMKPRSLGRLWLRSADPHDAPRIDLGYFSDPDDLPRMITALRIARRLARTTPLADVALEEVSPGPRVSDHADDLEAAIRTLVTTHHHPTGTCRMGTATDAGAVVDARGRVHGVRDLSVIDASILPTSPAANTNIPTLMAAERCAAWLAEDL